MNETVGISPKAIAALVWPAVVAAGIAVASWITTGEFNDSEIKVALAGVVTSLIAFAGSYIAPPGKVEGPVVPTVDQGDVGNASGAGLGRID